MAGTLRRYAAATLGVVALLGLDGHAQVGRPAGASDGQLIFGRVVDGDTGQPVAGVVVTISGLNVGPDGLPIVSAAAGGTGPDPIPAQGRMTDGEGRFVFRDMPSGSYRLLAQRPGYLAAQYGQARPGGSAGRLVVESSRVDATIRIWMFASVSGRVLDESGDPAVGVQVRALAWRLVRGSRRLAYAGGSSTTDDRGQYRLESLTPGEYIVAVPSTITSMPTSFAARYAEAMATGQSRAFLDEVRQNGSASPSGAAIRIGGGQQIQVNSRTVPAAVVTTQGDLAVYQTVYHPSATSAADARTLTLSSGQELDGIDIQRVLVLAHAVSGRITGPDGPIPGLGVRLIASDASDFSSPISGDAAETSTAADGTFVFPAVPPGSYVLRATVVPRASSATSMTMIRTAGGSIGFSSSGDLAGAPPQVPEDRVLWAEQAVTMGQADTEVGSLSLVPGARLSGRIRFEGGAERPDAQRLMRALSISLQPLDFTLPIGFSPGRADAIGLFRTMAYPPGRYQVAANGTIGEWHVKALLVGGRDVLDVPLELGASDIEGAELVLSDARTLVTGTVRRPSADVPAVVLAVPADYGAWLDAGRSPRRSRTLPVQPDGSFVAANLPPGDYLLAALPADQPTEFDDAAELAALLRGASRVTVTERAQVTASLILVVRR